MINLIAAVSNNGVIGNNGTIPWKSSTDMKLFKTFTEYSNVIMGRKTWDSLGRPLPNRNNFVISSTLHSDTCEVYKCLDCAITASKIKSDKDIWIIGGSQIYKEALEKNIPEKLVITKFKFDCEGDTVFPDIPRCYELTQIRNIEDFHLQIYRLNKDRI